MQDLLVWIVAIGALAWFGNAIRGWIAGKAITKLNNENQVLREDAVVIQKAIDEKEVKLAEILQNEEGKSDEVADETLGKNIH